MTRYVETEAKHIRCIFGVVNEKNTHTDNKLPEFILRDCRAASVASFPAMSLDSLHV
jgi:hypothetical protein